MRLLVPGVLAGAALILGGAILYEAVTPLDPVVIEKVSLPPRRVAAVVAPAYVAPSIDMFADIDARPLFSAKRQPLNDPQASGAAAASSDFVLVGVIMGGERAVALLRNRSTSATSSAVLGDIVNGWRVAKIDPTTVTLRTTGGEVIVPLDGPANRPPSAPLTAPAPAQSPVAPMEGAPPVASTAPSSTQTAAQFPLDPIIAPGQKPPSATPAKPPAPGKPGLPAHTAGGTISPDALKGATFDPKTGEPTL